MTHPLLCSAGFPSTRCHCTVASELVWDGGNTATAVGRHGQSLSVGDEWAPEMLFSLGVESDLMTTFLRLATEASLQVLAYVSAGQLVDVEDQETGLVVSVCIVVGSSAAEATAEEVWQQARATARTGRMLGSQLTVEAAIMVVGAEARH